MVTRQLRSGTMGDDQMSASQLRQRYGESNKHQAYGRFCTPRCHDGHTGVGIFFLPYHAAAVRLFFHFASSGISGRNGSAADSDLSASQLRARYGVQVRPSSESEAIAGAECANDTLHACTCTCLSSELNSRRRRQWHDDGGNRSSRCSCSGGCHLYE